MATKILKAVSNAEIISYFLNQNPELKEEIDLPVQGQSTVEIGRIIVDNSRYRNKFINTINLIGLTVIKENRWENPWQSFTDKGRLRFGQQIREIILDLAKVHDYNENYENKTKFLSTEVPNIYQYLHQLNYQKWYETTVNDGLLRMAFDNEEQDGLYTFINECVSNLYETYNYDKYLVDKYQLCRRIVDGTIAVKTIDTTSKTAREILSEMKGVANLMAFKSPNYNPAGVRRATKLENQFLMLDAKRQAINSTEVLATSYFLNEAEMKTNSALIDTFSETDDARLVELLEGAYTPFTDGEKTQLQRVLGMLIADDFFMDYYYALDESQEGKEQTEFRNPTSLDRNIFLHTWQVISTSPFANCCVFVDGTPSVSSVSVSPSTATVSKGQSIELSATVETSNFANKSVSWEINSVAKTAGAKINQEGKLVVPSDYTSTGSGTAGVYTIAIDTILETGDKIAVNGVEYTCDASSADTIAKQITALKSALNDAKVTDYFTIGGTSTTCTLTQKSGYYGQVEPIFVFTAGSGSAGVASIDETTAGVIPNNTIIVYATSIYDDTKFGTSKITVA